MPNAYKSKIKPTANRTHKNCSRCGYFLALDKFYRSNDKTDGRKAICMKCERKNKQSKNTLANLYDSLSGDG